ncbi:MAG: DeoR/GlpR transcriptional regulator [Clostridia bacterium]|nr:DeoR/GlpR transcriptional regulator [Clostridia bacterium]
MIQYERQNQILQQLEQNPSISIRKLATTLYASEATIRRDLRELEDRGLIRRVYGGAILTQSLGLNAPLYIRNQDKSDIKDKIAQEAAGLIRNGDTLLLDASSTTQHLIKYLPAFRDLTVITNCMTILEKLSNTKINLICTGGKYIPNNAVFIGHQTQEMLRNIYADILFFSSQGISENGDISDSCEEETALRRVMLQRARKRVFLCHSDKLGRQCLYHVCNGRELDAVICDKPLSFSNETIPTTH